jgi:pimeloyl-ACP methyl ester carboxylesterase
VLSKDFGGELFGPGQPLDASKYYIISTDGIGVGQSSKPSDGLRARFPAYNYTDMVQAQYRLVTEGLGVKHLRLIIGNSMGGMQTWMWGQTWPQMMDALVPMASQPTEMSSRNWMMRRLLVESIRLLEGRNSIRLDATPAGERVYRPLGFKEEFPLARYERPAGEFAAEPCPAVSADDWRWILKLDREAFGADRETLLRWLAEGAPDLAMSAGDGYCFGRRGYRFDHIGPIVARSANSAGRLLRAAMAKCSREVVVDAPVEHESALEGLGFIKQRPFLRMSLGQAPVFDAGLNFAITGPEFA